MPALYPGIEPYQSGLLEVGDGNDLYWETCGNPQGKPALVVHGGPGSGASPWFRRLFDPEAYRIVLCDQRNCGRSRPHASDPATRLDSNNTQNLLRDIESLRDRLEIDSWLVLGGSWGSVLSLAYTETHPRHVSELVVFGVATGRRSELDWLFRGGLARFFPEQWQRLARSAGDEDVVEAYARMLEAPDPDVRQRAAEEWCLWESATPHWPPTLGLDARFRDPAYAMCFARIVTHYVSNDLFLKDGVLLENADRLAGMRGVIVNGRFDFQSPIGNAWDLKEAWPDAELVIVDDAGHAAAEKVGRELVRATDEFRG